MDPVTATLIGAGVSSVGQYLTNRSNVNLGREQMRFQAQQIYKQQQFQERMSNTSYQRAVADLQAAGLNPALAYQQGGAQAMQGGAASGAMPQKQNSAASAREVALQIAQLKHLDAQTYKENREGSLAAARTLYEPMEAAARTGMHSAQRHHTIIESDRLEILIPLVERYANSEIARNLASALHSNTAAGLNEAQRILTEFGHNQARNMSKAQKSWYFWEVAPYVGEIGKIAPSFFLPLGKFGTGSAQPKRNNPIGFER